MMPAWGFGASGFVRASSNPRSARARAGRPHLLAVEHPVVPVPLATGAQRDQVRAGVGLGEELAPLLLGTDQRGQVAQLLLLGTGVQQRREHEVHADPQRSQRRRVVAPQFVLQGPQVRPGEAEPAVLLRHVGSGQAGGGELPLEGDRVVDEGLLAVGGAGDDVLSPVVRQGVEQLVAGVEERPHPRYSSTSSMPGP